MVMKLLGIHVKGFRILEKFCRRRGPMREGSESPGHILMGFGLPKAKLPCSRAPLHPFQGSAGSISQNLRKQPWELFGLRGSKLPK